VCLDCGPALGLQADGCSRHSALNLRTDDQRGQESLAIQVVAFAQRQQRRQDRAAGMRSSQWFNFEGTDRGAVDQCGARDVDLPILIKDRRLRCTAESLNNADQLLRPGLHRTDEARRDRIQHEDLELIDD